MTRILRARNPLSPKTPRKSFLGTRSVAAAGTDKWSGSKHDAQQLTGRTTSKSKVRRLMASNPLDPLSRPGVDQFTNNPNPKYDPSRKPGAVRRTTSVIRMSVGRAARGHAKAFRPNRQTLFGGKTLKRKQF